MTARIIIWMLALAEIYACFFVPDDGQNLAFHQLDIPNSVIHTVQAQQGFPAFLVKSAGGLINDATLFDLTFAVYTNNNEETPLPTIGCQEYIEKYISDPYTAD